MFAPSMNPYYFTAPTASTGRLRCGDHVVPVPRARAEYLLHHLFALLAEGLALDLGRSATGSAGFRSGCCLG